MNPDWQARYERMIRAARVSAAVGINSVAGLWVRWGGHGEGLRRRRGDAVGVKADASLIDRFRGERGNRPRSPFPPDIRSGGGQARVG